MEQVSFDESIVTTLLDEHGRPQKPMSKSAGPLFAIVLAGGASSRLHDSSPEPVVDKPLLLFDGKTLVEHVLDLMFRLVPAHRTVVVGPSSLPTGAVPTVVEQPVRSGPYMAVRAGIRFLAEQFGAGVTGEGVLLVAVDMPNMVTALESLQAHHVHLGVDSAGPAIVSTDGFLQPMLSYLPRNLAEQVFAEPAINAGVLNTLRRLKPLTIVLEAEVSADVDTYDDAVRLGLQFPDTH